MRGSRTSEQEKMLNSAADTGSDQETIIMSPQETTVLFSDETFSMTSSQPLSNPTLFYTTERVKNSPSIVSSRDFSKVSLLTIHQAARDGEFDVVKNHIISFGKDRKKLNVKDQEQSSALHYAVRYGHYSIVKLLVESGANINVQGEYGATPLHYAARYIIKPTKTPHASPTLKSKKIIRPKKTLRQFINFSMKGSDRKKSLSKSLKTVFSDNGKKKLPQTTRPLQRSRKNTIHGSLEELNEFFEKSVTEMNADAQCKRCPSDAVERPPKDACFHYGYEDNNMESECKKPVLLIGQLSQEEIEEMKTVDALILPQVKNVDASDISDISDKNDGVLNRRLSDLFHNSIIQKKRSATLGQKINEDSIINYLIEKKALINNKDFYGSTPLHYAAMRGNVTATKRLLQQKGINIEAVDQTNMTPLHCAANAGSFVVCKLLLDSSANLLCQDEEDMTPLHFASMEGYLDIVRLLFDVCEEQGGVTMLAKFIFSHDRDEQSALHLAVENNHIDIVDYCISKGSNVNLVKANMISPLHLSATAGLLEITKLLVENGAVIVAMNSLQETPLHRAALFNRVEIVEYLLQNGAQINCTDKDNETPLLMSVRKNNFETVKLLLKHKADLSVKDANDKTCLYIAAEENSQEAFDILCEHSGVKLLLNEYDKHEVTPLHVAAMKGHLQIVQALLSLGSCIDAKNDQNLTPLHLAAKHGQTCIVEILLANDLSIVNDEDDASNTPLHLAALEGHVQVVEILLESGAAVDARNAMLWTPLDCAASRGWKQCAQCLLDADSLINPTDKLKITPLHLASKEGHVDLINLLLSRNADVSRKDQLGRNCLDYAIDNNQRDAAAAIVGCGDWKLALRNSTVQENKQTTPMRKLIKKLPDVAEMVFNRCLESNGLPSEHPKFELLCTYEFLEDAFTSWAPPQAFSNSEYNQQYKVMGLPVVKESRFRRLARKPGYYKHSTEVKQNHPLKFMVQNERTRLLCHPLVTYLLRRKWSSCGRYVYYGKLLLYIVYLLFVTGFALSLKTDLRQVQCSRPPINTTVTECQCLPVQRLQDPLAKFFIRPGKDFVLVLAVLSLLIELVKLLSEVYHYIRFHSVIELTSYCCSVYYVTSLSDSTHPDSPRCSEWFRGLGAATVWLSWISLVLFMRKFPKLGIYVVMFTHILKTFAQFSLIFALFIIAFGLGFHLVLYEQKPISFATPARAILKTTMGMLGEFEYDTVFNNDTYNPISMAWVIYIAYLVINCIILMNLLVGLAVDDIKGVQKQAALKRLAMLVDLTLDVEKALPLSVQRRFACMKETIHPNANNNKWSVWSFWTFKSPTINLNEKSEVEVIEAQHTELRETVRALRHRMKVIEAQNNRIETMLTSVIKHLDIESQ